MTAEVNERIDDADERTVTERTDEERTAFRDKLRHLASPRTP